MQRACAYISGRDMIVYVLQRYLENEATGVVEVAPLFVFKRGIASYMLAMAQR